MKVYIFEREYMRNLRKILVIATFSIILLPLNIKYIKASSTASTTEEETSSRDSSPSSHQYCNKGQSSPLLITSTSLPLVRTVSKQERRIPFTATGPSSAPKVYTGPIYEIDFSKPTPTSNTASPTRNRLRATSQPPLPANYSLLLRQEPHYRMSSLQPTGYQPFPSSMRPPFVITEIIEEHLINLLVGFLRERELEELSERDILFSPPSPQKHDQQESNNKELPSLAKEFINTMKKDFFSSSDINKFFYFKELNSIFRAGKLSESAFLALLNQEDFQIQLKQIFNRYCDQEDN